WTRYVLRRALSDSLPKGVIARGNKSSSGLAVGRQFARTIDPECEQLMLQSANRLEHIVVPPAVHQALRRLRSDQFRPRIQDVFSVWLPFVLARWIDMFDLNE